MVGAAGSNQTPKVRTTATAFVFNASTNTLTTNALSLSGDVTFTNAGNRTLSIASTAAGTSGRILSILGGSTTAGGTNISGGSILIESGISTGSGISEIIFRTPTPGASGTTLNNTGVSMVLDYKGIFTNQGIEVGSINAKLTNFHTSYATRVQPNGNGDYTTGLDVRGYRYALIAYTRNTDARSMNPIFIDLTDTSGAFFSTTTVRSVYMVLHEGGLNFQNRIEILRTSTSTGTTPASGFWFRIRSTNTAAQNNFFITLIKGSTIIS
jgi:hypothetical protein